VRLFLYSLVLIFIAGVTGLDTSLGASCDGAGKGGSTTTAVTPANLLEAALESELTASDGTASTAVPPGKG